MSVHDSNPYIGAPVRIETIVIENGEKDLKTFRLAFCKKVIESHCGRITAESPPGCGTTFTISLPAGDK